MAPLMSLPIVSEALATPGMGHLLKATQAQIQRCHIALPGEDNPMAAIRFENRYYSFFKVISDRERVKAIVERLLEKGHTVVLVQIPTGHSLWVLESEARPSSSMAQVKAATKVAATKVAAKNVPDNVVLRSEAEYQPCQIQVPDLDKPLAGIRYQQQFYSLLRILRDARQAEELVDRLSQKGNRTVVTCNSYGYSVWVLELEAQAVLGS